MLGSFIDAQAWPVVLQQIADWAVRRESRYVCICNVHSIVTASRDAALGDVISQADMATPDGAPVAWMLRKLGFAGQVRINGPDLMWRFCARAAESGQSMFLYGSAPKTLELLQQRMRMQFPGVQIAGAYSPPFRALTAAEDEAVVEQINASDAGVVWVSLGCPKQEQWIAAHRGHINAVMVGVGAAFDYHAGTIQRAPLWMQKAGLEWLYRLVTEPRRLWRRYLVTNTLFIWGATRQLAARRLRG